MQPNHPLAFDSDFIRPQVLTFPGESLFFEPLSFELRNDFCIEGSVEKDSDANVSDSNDMLSFSPLSRSNSPITLSEGGGNHPGDRYNPADEGIAATTSSQDDKREQTSPSSKELGNVHEDVFMNHFMLLPSRDVKYLAQDGELPHAANSELTSLDVSPKGDGQLQLDENGLFRGFGGAGVQFKYHIDSVRDDASRDILQDRVHEVFKDETHAKVSQQNLLTGMNDVGEKRIERASDALRIVYSGKMSPPGHGPTRLPEWQQLGLGNLLQPDSTKFDYTPQASISKIPPDAPITDHEISHGLLSRNSNTSDFKTIGNQSLEKNNVIVIDEITKDVQASAKHKRQKMEQESGPGDDAPIAQWRYLQRDSMNKSVSGNKEEQTKAEQLKMRRAMRNRESARRSRIKSKIQFQTLEQRYAQLSGENFALNTLVEMIIPPSLRIASREATEELMTQNH